MAWKFNPFTEDFDYYTETTTTVSGGTYPKYIIPNNYDISIGVWEQYVIHEERYLDVRGSINLDEGAMIIIL